MATIPKQEEFLAATRKSQEAMIAAIRTWFETVRTATPRLTSVYAPLTERLPKLPPVSLPFAGKLPTPEETVDNAYHMVEQLLANQRQFAEDVLEAVAPLMPGRREAAPKGNGSSEPKVPSHRVWQEAVAVIEPKPVAVSEPRPVAVIEPKPVAVSEPRPVAVIEPKPVAVSEPRPVAVIEPKPAAVSEPKAPARPAAKSTPARPAPRTAASAAKSTASRTTTPKSAAAKSTPAKRTPAKRTPARPAPKGPDAS
jgi:outer membrane biosynthesis protein TonB